MVDETDTFDDDESAPSKEPSSSRPWLAMIVNAEKAYQTYQDKADGIDKLYADLNRLSNIARDRQFQMFWANIQVLGPSIYSRPPVPVVVPRFKDRTPLPRITSELLERSSIVAFEIEGIDGVMRQIRDDLVVVARGAAWLRYETKTESDSETERVCIDHVDRKDFLHDPARTWKEVDWVSKRSWLTKTEMRKRFKKHSGKAYLDASYEKRKDDKDHDDGSLKAGVWEVWSKSRNKVVWVSENVDKLLDEGDPHLKLQGFFPCPQPAYSTVQRRSLVPVPDMVFYKDQLEEINELTARIAALTEAIKVRGFYPAGAGEIGDAIETAVKTVTNNQVLIPISNWAMLGNGSVKDMIVWLPIEMIVKAVQQLVEMRRQLIDDVYQITGLSDIMRGSTDANETLGAQELKSQYGSIRVRDRQDELIRVARDITRISAEIMAENFKSKTLLDMSQMEIKTDADVSKEVKALEDQAGQIKQQIAEAQADPEVQAMVQKNPEKAQEVMGQAQQQIQQIEGQIQQAKEQVTIEKVMTFLRDNRIRPFVLDIETDSTIAPDENATKQRATEFVTAVGGFMGQVIPLLESQPQAAPLASDMLKYVASQFRAGREMEGTIEEFAEKMKAAAAQPKGPDPATMKAQADAQVAQQQAQTDAQRAQIEGQEKAQALQAQQAKDAQELQISQQEAQDAAALRQLDLQGKQQEFGIKLDSLTEARASAAQKHQQDMEKGALELAILAAKLEQTKVTTDATVAKTEAGIDAQVASTEMKKEAVSGNSDNPG